MSEDLKALAHEIASELVEEIGFKEWVRRALVAEAAVERLTEAARFVTEDWPNDLLPDKGWSMLMDALKETTDVQH